MATKIDHEELTKRLREQMGADLKSIANIPALAPLTTVGKLGWRGIQTLTGTLPKSETVKAVAKLPTTDNQSKTNLLETTKPKNNNLSTNFAGGPIPGTKQTKVSDTKQTKETIDPPSSGSTVFTKNKEGEALGVMTRNQRKQWEAANPDWQKWQPEGKGYTMSSVLKNDGSIVDTKAIKELPKDLNFGGKQALNVAKLPKGIDLNKGAEMFNPNNIKNMPSFAESMKMNNAADGTAGVGGAAALKIASMLLNAFNKKKGGGYVKEAGGGSIEKSIVTPNMNFDEFGTLPS